MLRLLSQPFAPWPPQPPSSDGARRDKAGLIRQNTTTTSSAGLPWDSILALCRSKLNSADFDAVCKFGSIEELVDYGIALQNQYRETTKAHDLARLSVFFHQLRAFHGSLDVLAHVQPTLVAPLWGSIRLCVELLQESNDVFQMVVDMFDEINGTLPRIDTYIEVLGRPQALIEPCQEVHLLIAEFACLVIRYYRTYPLKNLLVATWKPFGVDFERTIAKIRRKTSHIELEVKTLSLQLDVSRHEEIRRLLKSMDLNSRARLPCYFVPRPRYDGFVGREEQLELMRSHLQASSGGQLAVSLYGLGGVGKTQVALEYLYEHTDKYAAIFWLSADTEIRLGQDVRAAVVKLGLLGPEGSETDQQCLTLFKDWLQETEEAWLLILDNADDLKTLQLCWPRSRHGHVIVTSRDPGSSRYPSMSKAMKGIQIEPLSDVDGVALLLATLHSAWDVDSDTTTADETQQRIATTLVQQLGGLPLAINQIASYIVETDCTLDECWEIYSDAQNRKALFAQESGSVHLGYEHCLASVWLLSMTRVHAANPESSHLLQLLAILQPDGVPESLLDGSHGLQDHDDRTSIAYATNKFQLLNAVRALLQQSLISKNRNSRSLSMHRLVSVITKGKMTPTDRQQRFEDALELLYRVFPQLSVTKSSLADEWPRCRLYIAQIVALEQFYRDWAPALTPQSKFCSLLSNACWFLFEQGLLGQSMQMLPTAQAVGEATRPASQFALSTVHRAFGGILLDVNKPQKALENFSLVLELRSGLGELAMAQGLTNVALADLALQKTSAAKDKIDQAQEIYSRYPKEAEGHRAIMLDVSGLLQAQSGNADEGIRDVKEAIALYDQNSGVGNYWTAFANYEIGNMYVLLDQLPQAFRHHTQALSVQRDKLGETYSTAASLHKVAWHLYKRDDYTGAEQLLLQALKIYGEIYEGNGGLSRSNYLMSMILSAQGRMEDSHNCKTFAATLRQELNGTPPEEDDALEAYDLLVGWQHR